jgi:multiple sugar transport system substrate-binding protein
MRIVLLLAALLLAASHARAETRTITVATHYTDAQMQPLLACFRAYEAAHPGLRIATQQSDIADYLQTLITAHLGGTTPDIENIYSQWSGQLVGAGLLAPPPPDVQDFVTNTFEPSVVEGLRVRDKSWGVPGEISTYMLVYNKRLLHEAGFDAPPRSWDELRMMAAKITHRNAQGNITTAGFAFGPTVANAVHPFLAMLFSKGGQAIRPDRSGTALQSPPAAAALAEQVDLFATGITSNAVQVRDFPSGTVGMAIIANWFKNTLRQGFGDAFADTVGVAPIPEGPDWKTLQYGFFWGVDAKSPEKAEAWALLRWLNTPRAPGQRSCMGDMLVSMGALTGNRTDIAASADELGDAFSRPYVEAISKGRAIAEPTLLHQAEVDQAMRAAIEKAWAGTVSPAAALAQADRQIAPLLADEP